MIDHPLRAITRMLVLFSAAPALLAAAALAAGGRQGWALGVALGWTAGCLNAGLLAFRVSRLTARSSVVGFLFSAASRFTLVGLIAIGSYRVVGAHPVGFAIGIACVLVMNVPASLIWSMRTEPAT